MGILTLASCGYYATRVIPRVLERTGSGPTAAAATGRRFLYRQYEHPFFSNSSGGMTKDEALLVLGLEPTATPTAQEVKDRYRKLMGKFHSDVGGSDVVSSKINEARDALLKQ